MTIETPIFQGNGDAWQPVAHFIKCERNLHSRPFGSEFGDFTSADVEERRWSRERRLQFRRQRQPNHPEQGCRNDDDENRYSPETTHTLDGVRPENRLSYMGEICVAGHLNVPAAVARARTEYVPLPA